MVNQVPAPRTTITPPASAFGQADEQKHTPISGERIHPMLQRTFRRSAQLAPQAAGAISRHTSDRDAHGDAGARDRPPLDETDVASSTNASLLMQRCAAAGACRCVESRPRAGQPVAATLHDGGCRVGTGGGTRAALTRHVSAHALAGCRVTYDGQHVWTSRRCPRRPSRVAAGW